MTEARKLLERAKAVCQRLDDDESGRVFADINTYLAQDTAEEALLVEALQDAADVLGCISVNSLARLEFRQGALKALRAARVALADTSPAAAALLAESNELKHFQELTGMDGLEFEKVLDEATGLCDWTGTPNGAMFRALLAQGEKTKKLERTLARAQRIIGSLHIERAKLIQRLAALSGEKA